MYIDVYMCQKIFYKELAHKVMEASNPQDP